MALLLPQCTALPESLYQLATLRQRLSVQQRRPRRSARAKHGTTERTTKTQATSNDHIKIASTEPCCKISSLVMVPRKPTRRSSRLRAKKGQEGAKTVTAEDMEVAEWVNQVLANNGMVEVDPVTMAELSGGKTDSSTTHHRIASLTTSSEVQDYYPPRGPAFPRFPGVPFEVAIAAGSVVALATIAAILNAVSNQTVGAKPSQSDSEGNYLGSDFAGEPIKSSNGANPSQLTKDKKLPVDVLASTAGVSAGTAILTAFDMQPGSVKTGLDYSAMPLPPSLSKNKSKRDSPPHEQQREWDSVTPFFTSHRSSESYPRPTPSNSRWAEEKYKSVAPFFFSDRSATNGSSSESVTPFFVDEQQGIESQNGTSLESVTPFFPDDQGRGLKNGPSLEAVTPFFADDQGSGSKNGISLESVAPFFPDDQGRGLKNGPSLEAVTPFFADDQGSGSKNGISLESVAPFFPDDQGRGLKNGPSLEAVTPFFADDQGSGSKNGISLESVAPFFPDDQGRGLKNGPSLEAVTPFFADDQGSGSKNGISLESVAPFFPDDQGRGLKNGPSLEAVTPFFADDQGSESKNGISLENVTPFSADEQGRSSTGMSQSKGSYQNVKPFFPDDRVGRSGIVGQTPISALRGQSGVWNGESNEAMRDSLAYRMVNLRGKTPVNSSQFVTVPDDFVSGPIQSEGKRMLADMANRSQDQHREFMEGTTADRLASEMRNGSSFGGESVGRPLSPEELALLEEIKEEEARQHAKFQALQAAFPALAIGAGAVGALVGVDGAFEMVGLTAISSFISYELLWANKRKDLLDEISTITDHHKLFRFLQKKKILKDDC